MIYTNENRGRIQFPNRARQLINFSGIRYGAITPTDEDGFLEIHDKLYVHYEYKFRNARIPDGQFKAFVNKTNALQESGREAVFIICRHDVENVDEMVNAATTPVDKFYYNHKWWSGKGRTAKEVTDKFYYHFIDKDNS